jgi:hypothetical protein
MDMLALPDPAGPRPLWLTAADSRLGSRKPQHSSTDRNMTQPRERIVQTQRMRIA